MPDEDKTFSGSLVLDLRIWWGHVNTLYCKRFARDLTAIYSFWGKLLAVLHNWLKKDFAYGETYANNIHSCGLIIAFFPEANCKVLERSLDIWYKSSKLTAKKAAIEIILTLRIINTALSFVFFPAIRTGGQCSHGSLTEVGGKEYLNMDSKAA